MLQLSKKSLWPPLRLRFLYLHASGGHQQTFNRSRSFLIEAVLSYSNQQQLSPSSFIYSAFVASSIPFSNLTNTEFYNLLLFDNSDLSNFIESFPCDLSPQHYQTKYSTLSDTGKMNHANKPKKLSYFHFNVRSLGKNKHKLDDVFLMTEVNPTFMAISETKLKPNFIANIDIPGFNFVYNPSQINLRGVGLYINSKLTYQLTNLPK